MTSDAYRELMRRLNAEGGDVTIPYNVRRSHWVEAAYPVTGPAFNWSEITDITMHYPGGGTMPTTDAGKYAYVRGMQRSYVNSRGYSIGYNAVIFADGSLWELRGDTFRAASNGNQETNRRAYTIQFAVNGNNPATDLAVAKARQVVAAIRARRPNAKINRHSDVRATSCPGVGISAQVTAGVFEPPPPLPPPPPPIEEDDMPPYVIRDEVLGGTFLPDGTPVSWEVWKFLEARGVPRIDQNHEQWRATARHRMGPTAAAQYGTA